MLAPELDGEVRLGDGTAAQAGAVVALGFATLVRAGDYEAAVAVVAPATANVLAKLTQGIADDLLTSTLLEASCPLVLAPAMHTGMWEHPATQANANTLTTRTEAPCRRRS